MDTLAYYMYPVPSGTRFTADNLISPQEVETVFDYLQILLAVVSQEGWDFLIQQHGYEILFEINKKSGWIDCETLSEFILQIEYEREISPEKL